MYEELGNILQQYPIDFAVMEGAAFGGSRAVQQGEVAGVVKLALYHNDVRRIITIAPGTWKHFTIGTLKKKPEDVYIKAVNDMYGYQFNNTDEADAFMMWDALSKISNTPIENLTPAASRIFNQLSKFVAEIAAEEMVGEK